MGERLNKISSGSASVLDCLWYFGLSIVTLGGWLTRVVVCFQNHYYGFLIAGAIVFPIAVIHGWGLWFGWWH